MTLTGRVLSQDIIDAMEFYISSDKIIHPIFNMHNYLYRPEYEQIISRESNWNIDLVELRNMYDN